MKTWLNPDTNLHTDLLMQQVVIGELLKQRFVKQEDWVSHYQISIELNQLNKIIYERKRNN